MDATSPVPFGKRLQALRTQRGMTREVLGGLVGKNARWLKAVEAGEIQQPKLAVLLRLADALRIDDLSELTGTPESALRSLGTPGHPALPAVRDAINAVPWAPGDVPPEPLPVLRARLDAAWRARHASPDHRTVLGSILPSLIRDTQRAVQASTGDERRHALAIMTGVWNLTQFFVAYQPDSGLLWRVAERGMTAAMESGDPHATGGAVWLLAQAHRDAGEFEAAEEVNLRALEYLEPYLADGSDEFAGIFGALLFEVAYTAARSGQRGTAWGYWDRAEAVARRLPPGYYDPMTSFSRVIMAAHAVTVGVEARQRAESLRQARRADALAIPSQPRRGRHLIEVARAYRLSGDDTAALGTLQSAYRTAPETMRWNGYARQMTQELAESGPAGLRREAAGLAQRLGVSA